MKIITILEIIEIIEISEQIFLSHNFLNLSFRFKIDSPV